MGRKTQGAAAPRGRGWRWPLLAAFVILGIGAAVITRWPSDLTTMSSGLPRLLVDHTEIDLGYRRFETPVRAVFILTNVGTGPVRLGEASPVTVRSGC
jgi:hypothetical protein